MKRIAYLVTNRGEWVLVAYAAIALLLAATASVCSPVLRPRGTRIPMPSPLSRRDHREGFQGPQPDVQIAIDLRSNADAAANKTLTSRSSAPWRSKTASQVRWGSYYSLGLRLRSRARTGMPSPRSSTSITARVLRRGSSLAEKFRSRYQSADLYYSGDAIISHEINASISKDLAKAESFAIPLTFIIR